MGNTIIWPSHGDVEIALNQNESDLIFLVMNKTLFTKSIRLLAAV